MEHGKLWISFVNKFIFASLITFMVYMEYWKWKQYSH